MKKEVHINVHTQGRKIYFSAEFQLEEPRIFFQVKVRDDGEDAMFALIGKDSMALALLKPGNLIPMIYHFQDRTIPAEHRITRIKYLQDGGPRGFNNHFLVGLDIKEDK